MAVSAVALAMLLAPGCRGAPTGRPAAGEAVIAVAGLQVVTGLANVLLLAPVSVQMVHLLVADVVWVLFVILSAQVLAWEGARR